VASKLNIEVGDKGTVSAILTHPRGAKYFYLFAHGAGAGMHHHFMEQAAETLAEEKIASLRFNFLYTEAGKKRPDHRTTLLLTVEHALAEARKRTRKLPLIAGGKSMGGRMTSLLCADEKFPEIQALVYFGFPLHPPGKQGVERAAHLQGVRRPMLFLQGSKDKLANLDLLRPIARTLEPGSEVHVIDDGDHGFHVPKRSGRTDDDVIEELARTTRSWCDRLLS
jgi:predicted alpha/beta-hydrolase family hydrolase